MTTRTTRWAACAFAVFGLLCACTSGTHNASSPSASRLTSTPAPSASESTPSADEPTRALPIPNAPAPSAARSGTLAIRVEGSGTGQWRLRGISCTTSGFTSKGTVFVTSTSTSLTVRAGTPVDGLTIKGATHRIGNARVFSGQADTVTVQTRVQC